MSLFKAFEGQKSGQMPDKCVIFGCNNRPSKTEGISLHPIPFEGADEPEKRKRRKKWVDFIKSKRAHWSPRSTRLCAQNISETTITK